MKIINALLEAVVLVPHQTYSSDCSPMAPYPCLTKSLPLFQSSPSSPSLTSSAQLPWSSGIVPFSSFLYNLLSFFTPLGNQEMT